MGFYYWSLFSVVPLAIAYGVLAPVFWWIVWTTRNSPRRVAIRTVAAIGLLILPVSEELWIAWNFAQACKGAGTIIKKKVTVDGFYDDTMRSAYELTSRLGYRYAEHRTEDRRGIERVERTGEDSAAITLDWYRANNPGKGLPSSVIRPLSGGVQIVVFPRTGEAWKVTKLDRPTAQYSYIHPHNHTRIAHKVDQNERQVVDTVNKEVLAQEINFGRDAPWFYIGLDRPLKMCYGRRDPELRGSIYLHVLLPSKERR